MEEENLTKQQKQERVYNLSVEIADLEVKKKSTNASFNEELKRLKMERKDLFKEDQQTFEIA